MRNYSFLLSLSLSLLLHGLLVLCFIISPKTTPPKSMTSFEMVWEEKEPPLECLHSSAPKGEKSKKVVRVSAPSPQKEKMRFARSETSLTRNSQKNSSLKPISKHVARTAYRPMPTYPWICRKRKQEGVVVIQVKSDASGHAQEVTLYKSSGHEPLDKAALETLKSWVFAEDFHQKILSIVFRLKR